VPCIPFTGLRLLVGLQEEHLACKSCLPVFYNGSLLAQVEEEN